MRLLSTASTITHTFKNVSRLREILAIFFRHGFAEMIDRMHLGRFLPGSRSEDPGSSHLPPQARLRLAFEELGPTYVKLGQLLATRPDLIPLEFVEEFQKLQDRVTALPYETIQAEVENELGKPLTEVFQTFEKLPMAAASIAQAHGAILKDGTRVAVKVQRPGIEKIIRTDVSILETLAQLMERYLPETKMFNPVGVVEEFFKTITFELDFRIEANNMRRIRENLSEFKKVAIPIVYTDYSTARVLTMERFDGIRVSELDRIRENKINATEVVETGCDVFFHMVMEDGLFHGDFHAGNLFILPDGRIGLIDFGIVGRLSRRVRDSVTTMFVAMMDEDYESLALEYLTLSTSSEGCDLNRLQKDLMDLISPYIGMSLGEVDIGKILLRSTAVAARHHLQVPRELLLLFKAMVTIESLGKNLDENFDLLSIGTKLAKKTLTSRYNKEQIVKDLIVVGRELQFLVETTPRFLKQFLRRFSQNNYVWETKNKDIAALAFAVRQWNYTFLVATLSVVLAALGITMFFVGVGPQVLGLPLWGLLPFACAGFVILTGILRTRKQFK